MHRDDPCLVADEAALHDELVNRAEALLPMLRQNAARTEAERRPPEENIRAIEEAGLKPGADIKIVSVDAVRAAFEAMIDGKLNVTIECNPLLGPPFFETALRLANGAQVEKWVRSQEEIFRQQTAEQDLPKRQY